MAIIITSFVSFPLGLTMLVLNLPTFYLGYKQLGGTAFLARSLLGTVAYNLGVDLTATLLPTGGVTDEMILNAIFGGVILGLGAGLIYRAGGTAGAGGILNLTLQKWRGWPIRLATLTTNGLIIGLAGLVFGWEAAMYAFISFYVSGALADFVLEGPDVVRTALIITDKADAVAGALMDKLGRGVTRWTVTGMHSNDNHTALYCTVTRPQIKDLKNIVAWVDPDAFVIIGEGREALGQGFHSLEPDMPVVEDLEDDSPVK